MKIDKKKKSYFSINILFNIIAPLVIAFIFYYLFSPELYFVKKIDSIIGDAIHITNIKYGFQFFKFMRNYFMDMLWGYSLIFAMFLTFDNNTAELKKIYIIAAIFSIIIEFLSFFWPRLGTFDLLDIVAELLAELVAVFIIKSNKML